MDQQVGNRQQLIKEIFGLVHEDELPSLILQYKITRGELADALRPLDYDVTDTGDLIEEVKELARGQDVDLSFLNEPKESPLATDAATQRRLRWELRRLRRNSSAARTATKTSRITQGAAAMEPPARAHTTASDTDDLGQLMDDVIANRPRELWVKSVVDHRLPWSLLYVYFERDEPGWLQFVSELRLYGQLNDVDLSFFGLDQAEVPLSPSPREREITALSSRSLDEIASAIINQNIERQELTDTFDSRRLNEIDSAVTRAYNANEQLAVDYWCGLTRDLTPTLTAADRHKVIHSLPHRPSKEIYNEIFLHKICRRELQGIFDTKQVGSIIRDFQHYKARDRVDIAFLDVDSPAVIMANEAPAADATHDSQADAQVGNSENSAAGDNANAQAENSENTVDGDNRDETSSVSIVSSEEFLQITREVCAEADARRQNAHQTRSTTRAMALRGLRGIADIDEVFKHILDHKLTFGEVSKALPEVRFQAVVHHIFNLREDADLTSFWKLDREASSPIRLYTHYVLHSDGTQQKEPDGFIFLRRNLRFWLLPPLPFPIPPCPLKPATPPIILPGTWPGGMTIHGDPKTPAMVTVDASPSYTTANKPTVQFHHGGRVLGWAGKSPIVSLLQSREDTIRIAAEKLRKASDANAAAMAKFQADMLTWAADRRRWEWILFRLAQQHIHKVRWTEHADANDIMAASEASAYCSTTVEEAAATIVRQETYQKWKRERDE